MKMVRNGLSTIFYITLYHTSLETQLVKVMVCIETQGKRGRTVPIILTPTYVRCLELLIRCRKNMGVVSSNLYLFTVSCSDNHIRGYDALKRYVNVLPLEVPEAITGTNLRKHIATMSQVLNLKEFQLDGIAGFLWHDLKIHCEYYKQAAWTDVAISEMHQSPNGNE